MKNLADTIDNVVKELEDLDLIRERVIALTRQLTRISGRSIANIVMGKSIDGNIEKAKSIYDQLKKDVEQISPVTSWKTVGSGVEEYSELIILHSLIKNKTVPSPQEINVPSWIWLSSLGDVTGELRRIILNRLLNNSVEEARSLLESMQAIYQEISGLSFSKSMIPNFRRKIDTARVTIERTESDVLNYLISAKTEVKL